MVNGATLNELRLLIGWRVIQLVELYLEEMPTEMLIRVMGCNSVTGSTILGFYGSKQWGSQFSIGPRKGDAADPETDFFFLNKVFGGHTSFLGPLVPLYWISGDVSSGV